MKQERGITVLAPMYQMLAKVCIMVVTDAGCTLVVRYEVTFMGLMRAEGRLQRAD